MEYFTHCSLRINFEYNSKDSISKYASIPESNALPLFFGLPRLQFTNSRYRKIWHILTLITLGPPTKAENLSTKKNPDICPCITEHLNQFSYFFRTRSGWPEALLNVATSLCMLLQVVGRSLRLLLGRPECIVFVVEIFDLPEVLGIGLFFGAESLSLMH